MVPGNYILKISGRMLVNLGELGLGLKLLCAPVQVGHCSWKGLSGSCFQFWRSLGLFLCIPAQSPEGAIPEKRYRRFRFCFCFQKKVFQRFHWVPVLSWWMQGCKGVPGSSAPGLLLEVNLSLNLRLGWLCSRMGPGCQTNEMSGESSASYEFPYMVLIYLLNKVWKQTGFGLPGEGILSPALWASVSVSVSGFVYVYDWLCAGGHIYIFFFLFICAVTFSSGPSLTLSGVAIWSK